MGFDADCREKLTKRNGQAKGGPKAVCTLCSACEDYSSGWCADNCAQYGEATVAESHTVKAFRSCLAGSVVPKRCVKQHRRLEDEEERELSHEADRDLAPVLFPPHFFRTMCEGLDARDCGTLRRCIRRPNRPRCQAWARSHKYLRFRRLDEADSEADSEADAEADSEADRDLAPVLFPPHFFPDNVRGLGRERLRDVAPLHPKAQSPKMSSMGPIAQVFAIQTT